MSYTQHVGTATCKVSNILDTNDLISSIYDYLNSPIGKATMNLLNCESFEEFADYLEPYVQLSDDILTLSIDTDESNNDCEVFDFLVDHCAQRMSSRFMKVVWVTYDSRIGLSGDVCYYDKQGEIDIEKILNTR